MCAFITFKDVCKYYQNGETKIAAADHVCFEAEKGELVVIGVDISKDALIQAARRSKELRLAAASSAALPLPDGSIGLILNIFSPFMGGEFRRVLCPGGKLIRAYPLARHLWELKALIYDRPYENPVSDMQVIRIGKLDLSSNLLQILCSDSALDRSDRTDIHEYRCLYRSMNGLKFCPFGSPFLL